jgi:putative ubiquitin-RnfH superfamily antitoxin RatB of RatAB toxin-antitoxin module
MGVRVGNSRILVEVAYALPEHQRILEVEVAQGTTAFEAVVQSGITRFFPEIDLESSKMGIFGKAVAPKTQQVVAGDRIEIYRPLIADPKAARKERAEKVKATP